MSRISRNEATPIIIKGKTCPGDMASRYCFDISVGQEFKIETEYRPDSLEWVKSTTVHKCGGIGSITIGEDGPHHQYCKTSRFVRPITVRFISKVPEGDDRLLFTVSEGTPDEYGDCELTISVQDDTFFTATPASAQNDEDWDTSEGSFSNAVNVITVSDSSDGGDNHCCCLLTLDEPISVNVLPPTI